jgi:phosphatidylinositol alpha 1,6-mannosyltransferase
VQLVIVGDGVDQRKLQSAMPTAVFTGALYGDHLAAAYASMDVFVHTGEHETFCQVVQEAQASGLPVIAPDAGGPRDLVAPYRTGLLLPVNEFEARLPAAVAHLLEERQRYSQAARRSVLGRSWPVICDELLGHYEAVQSPEARTRARARTSLRRYAQGE